MTVSDWVLIGTTVFLGIIAIWGEQIRNRLFPPKVKITFEETPPYCHKTYYRNPQLNPSLNEPVYFFRFKVENTGTTKLKRCEAVLEQIWIYDSAGKPKRLSGYNYVTLVWEAGRPAIIDLDPYRGRFCNIGHIASLKYQKESEAHGFIDIPGKHPDALRFLFELAEYPFSQPNCLLPGKYALKIAIYSENVSPKELWLEIAWSGKWQDTESEMFRELTINQITSLESPTLS